VVGVIEPPAPAANAGQAKGSRQGLLMRVWSWAKGIAVFAYELLTNV